MAVMLNGIDISSHQQGGIDFKKLKSAGYSFVMLRAGLCYTNGSIVKDECFDDFYKSATAAGLDIGAYIFDYSTTVAGAVKAAKGLLNLVADKKITYPLCYDLEYDAYNINPNLPATDMAIAAMKEIEGAGYYAMIYTNPHWLSEIYQYSRLTAYDIWLASWPKQLGTPRPTAYAHGIWQYAAIGTAEEVKKGWATHVGSVPGISVPCDVDFAYKDFAAIIRNAGLNCLTGDKKYTVTASATVTGEEKANELSDKLKELNLSVTIKEI